MKRPFRLFILRHPSSCDAFLEGTFGSEAKAVEAAKARLRKKTDLFRAIYAHVAGPDGISRRFELSKDTNWKEIVEFTTVRVHERWERREIAREPA